MQKQPINVQFSAKSATLETKSQDQQIKKQDILFKCLPAVIEPVGYDKEGNIYLMVSERSDTAKVIIERTIQKYCPKVSS